MQRAQKVKTCLWFDQNGEEAADFYVSLMPNSAVLSKSRPGPDHPAAIIEFVLVGAPFVILNGGPSDKLSPAVSISVTTADQAETDALWSALLEGGGEESMCGWLTDRFGLSWQITPEALPRLISSDDRAAAARVRDAMMAMRKIDIAALEVAFRDG